VEFPLPVGENGKPLNHPANIGAVYRFATELLQTPIESLAGQVEENFKRVFAAMLNGERLKG
jgi:TatD DNase family protein